MHILLSNDDGIQARGILRLCEVLVEAGHRVSVCAPDRERSAASHSATLRAPMHPVPVQLPPSERAWQVDGTPADCARLGLYLLREDPPDLVIAGINRGMNMGGACIYSGTVAAAMEAAMNGTQALAVSLFIEDWSGGEDYTAAARLAERVARWAVRHPLPRGVIYNLNVPPLPYGKLRGLVPAKLAPIYLSTPEYEPGRDGQGVCYTLKNGASPPMEDPDYDVVRVEQGYAAITKLTWDFRAPEDDAELAEIGI